MKGKLLVDIRDDSGDTDLFIPANTIVDLLDLVDDVYIAQDPNSDLWFSVDTNDVAVIQ